MNFFDEVRSVIHTGRENAFTIAPPVENCTHRYFGTIPRGPGPSEFDRFEGSSLTGGVSSRSGSW